MKAGKEFVILKFLKFNICIEQKVFGGWLVLDNTFDHIVMVFVPDKDHEWEIESI